MGLDDTLGDGEPEAEPAGPIALGARCVRTIEAVEDVGQVLGGMGVPRLVTLSCTTDALW